MSEANDQLTPAEIGRRLAAERQRLGLSQRGAAWAVGMCHSTLAHMETDGANPTTLRLMGFAAAGYDLRRVLPELWGGKRR